MSIDFDGVRICGVADHLGSADCLWPMRDVTVFAGGSINGVSLADAAEQAIKGWNDVCGLRLAMTANPKTANLFTSPKSLDGAMNVLAQCQLPCGGVSPTTQLLCDVDLAEAFVLATNPPGNKIDLIRVLMHEYGHGIGIPHIGSGNLMAPIYSSSIRLPQDGDIVQARSRYGDRAVVPVPPVNPPVSPRDPVIGPRLEFVDNQGVRWRANVAWEQV